MPRKKAVKETEDSASKKFHAGVEVLYAHPLFAPFRYHSHIVRHEGTAVLSSDVWAIVRSDGEIHVHANRKAEPEEWAYVLAHCLLHLGFGHILQHGITREWNAACDYAVSRFLNSIKIGRPPRDFNEPMGLTTTDEGDLAALFRDEGIARELLSYSTGGSSGSDMVYVDQQEDYWGHKIDWQRVFATGLSAAVTSAVNVAGGLETSLGVRSTKWTAAQRARSWFISSYPLLGALAASFDIIEDPSICQRTEVSVAAVWPEGKEIYINPAAALSDEEAQFVIAHELLHVGLRHDTRRRGRDPYLWNVACDYVINDWLIEMGVGDIPRVGLLHDLSLRGESAESIYDRIARDMRKFRRLTTFRGIGSTDIIERRPADWWKSTDGMTLDEFYRRCLAQGLVFHQDQGRGLLPAALVEEIRALEQPPIPWDVELAKWFDEHFPPIDKERTFARPSRRQSSTPDIPRPRYVTPPEGLEGRTYGVVLDTSGSMDRSLLAMALGAIASYSASRDVPMVRVVFCDAVAYDAGYMATEDIAGKVKVKGRGGTVLQPGVDLLEGAEDFPKKGPILLITDGYCEPHISIRRDHAFLLPEGHTLPFPPRGPVFRIR